MDISTDRVAPHLRAVLEAGKLMLIMEQRAVASEEELDGTVLEKQFDGVSWAAEALTRLLLIIPFSSSGGLPSPDSSPPAVPRFVQVSGCAGLSEASR